MFVLYSLIFLYFYLFSLRCHHGQHSISLLIGKGIHLFHGFSEQISSVIINRYARIWICHYVVLVLV